MIRLFAIITGLTLSACMVTQVLPTRLVKSLEGIECSRLSEEQKACVAKAQEDFRRIEEGKDPLHAKVQYFANDGGTVFYQGYGYEITSWHKIENRNGKNGYLVGPQAVLKPEITGGRSIACDSTTFVPMD